MLLAAVNFTVIIIVILKITKSSIVIVVKSSHFPLIQCQVVIKQFVIRAVQYAKRIQSFSLNLPITLI